MRRTHTIIGLLFSFEVLCLWAFQWDHVCKVRIGSCLIGFLWVESVLFLVDVVLTARALGDVELARRSNCFRSAIDKFMLVGSHSQLVLRVT